MYEDQFRVSGKVLASALGRASTGTEQVAVQFEYVDPQSRETRSITWYGYFSSEKAQEIADDALKALGWDPAKNGWNYYVLNDDSPEQNPILGKTAQLVLGMDEDLDGNPQLRVKFVNSGGGLAMKERMDPDAAKAFSAKMRARVGGVAPSAPRPQPAAPRPAPAPAAKPNLGAPIAGVDEDSIPFAFLLAMLTIVGGALMA